MPEFAEEEEHANGSGPIPNLFPDKLVDLCLDKVFHQDTVDVNENLVLNKAVKLPFYDSDQGDLGKHLSITCHLYLGIAQIAITPPPRTQTGTFFLRAILPFLPFFKTFFYHFL